MMILLIAHAVVSIVVPDDREVIAGERCYALDLNGGEVSTTRQPIHVDRVGDRRAGTP